ILLAMALVVLGALACAAAQSDQRYRDIPILIGVILAGIWTQWFTAFRPVTAAMVLLAACAWLLLRDRKLGERSRAVWFVPPLVAVTVNLHFFAAIVPCWLGAVLVGAILEQTDRKRRVWRYIVLFALSGLALCATPMLPGMMSVVRSYA